MKAFILSICVAATLFGCALEPTDKAVALRPLVVADSVRVHDNQGASLAVGSITNKHMVAKLVSLVNSLPQDWSVPWYGPPVGRVYFDFFKGETNVGNFYVGPNFFGRDVFYREGTIKFYSQSASETQIRDLGRIVGFNVWEYVRNP